MEDTISSIFHTLISRLATLEGVWSIGRSGGRPLPQSPDDGDIDVFIYCDAVPPSEARRSIMDKMKDSLGGIAMDVIGGGHWGIGDLAHIRGVETWLMYFTLEEAEAETAAVLCGDYPDKIGNYYYPTGRCAMFLGMDILCDKSGFLKGMQDRFSVYPEDLSQKLATYHLDSLGDVEDLERAVARKDVLFYHFALDLALDHFLQALFAMNKVFFPSRKRSLEYFMSFRVKPDHCENRLLDVLRLGSAPDGVGQSYELWQALIQELREIASSLT